MLFLTNVAVALNYVTHGVCKFNKRTRIFDRLIKKKRLHFHWYHVDPEAHNTVINRSIYYKNSA